STGGKPSWAVVAIALRADTEVSWLTALYEGMAEAAARYGVPIVGGDTVGTTGPITLCVTVVGQSDRPRLRSDARPGDVLVASGPLGLSAAGLWALRHPQVPIPATARQRAQLWHQRPQPPGYPDSLAQLERIALMDDSDGLGVSVQQMAMAAQVAIVVEGDKVMLDLDVGILAACAKVDPLDWVLWGGEDYGLVAAIPAEAPLPPHFAAIGHVEAGAGAWLERDGIREALTKEGFGHFAV
ncbi:MAG: hypothetical protein KGR26_12750, partial [Cyanobacteria bacterium REEB65]|nr:hypothetical protein [Cyanobacteria bacterium REEB65]